MLFSRAVDKLIQSDAEDLVHLTQPSVEEATCDPMKPRLRALQRQPPMSQLLSWIDEEVISGLLLPSFYARGCEAEKTTNISLTVVVVVQ